jgi:hypothetical protein
MYKGDGLSAVETGEDALFPHRPVYNYIPKGSKLSKS